jgi:nucleoside-diphosphate-sugar epimerase
MSAKVLITGCAGFLGHHVVRHAVERGWEVVGVDRRPVPAWHAQPTYFVQVDVRDLTFRDLMGVDYVVHLAFGTNIAYSVRHPEETTLDSINMTLHLLELCRETGVKKFVFPSTASLYTSNPLPWREDAPPRPVEPYSWQKLACEYACDMYTKTFHVPTSILRFFLIFGEGQRPDMAMGIFERLVAEGKPITLTECRPGSPHRSAQRDFIYAGDVARAVVLAVESPKTGQAEIINVASGRVHEMEEIAQTMGAKIAWIPMREYEVERHLADIARAREWLGWAPEVDIVDWLRARRKGAAS